MDIQDETALIAGIFGSSLALIGAHHLDWRKAYLILVSGCCLAYFGTPFVAKHIVILQGHQGIVGFVLGLLGIKIVDWLLSMSMKDIIKAVTRR